LHRGIGGLDKRQAYIRTIGEAGDAQLVSQLLEVAPTTEVMLMDLLHGATKAGHDELALQVLGDVMELPTYSALQNRVKEVVAVGGCVRTAAAIDDDPRAWVRLLPRTLKKGHQPFVEWVLADVIVNADAQYVAFAATSGSLELVKWLCAKGYPVGGRAMRNAASSGNVALCKWVLDHGIGPTQDAMEVAVVGGHVEVLEWLSTQGCSCTRELLRHAVFTGGLPLVTWCLDHHMHPPNAGDLLALSCINELGSDVFEHLVNQRGFQSSPTELMRFVAEHRMFPHRLNFDAAVLVKRYDTPLYSHYMFDAIRFNDLDRLRFALSQGQEVSMVCYKRLLQETDATLLIEVLLARKVGDSVPEVDYTRIKEALFEVKHYDSVSKVALFRC
jgi:hypothetical protein